MGFHCGMFKKRRFFQRRNASKLDLGVVIWLGWVAAGLVLVLALSWFPRGLQLIDRPRFYKIILVVDFSASPPNRPILDHSVSVSHVYTILTPCPPSYRALHWTHRRVQYNLDTRYLYGSTQYQVDRNKYQNISIHIYENSLCLSHNTVNVLPRAKCSNDSKGIISKHLARNKSINTYLLSDVSDECCWTSLVMKQH